MNSHYPSRSACDRYVTHVTVTWLQALKKETINAASSKFYTLIPHSFGRSVPPALATEEAVNKKFEMLNVLGDIVAAQVTDV